jgi:hypothetical protein
VIVEPPADKPLVYWGTPQVEEALDLREWPRVYRERNAIQELSFKRMIDHGGLDVRFISSLPVMQQPACKVWADKRHVQIVWAVR